MWTGRRQGLQRLRRAGALNCNEDGSIKKKRIMGFPRGSGFSSCLCEVKVSSHHKPNGKFRTGKIS